MARRHVHAVQFKYGPFDAETFPEHSHYPDAPDHGQCDKFYKEVCRCGAWRYIPIWIFGGERVAKKPTRWKKPVYEDEPEEAENDAPV